MNTTRYILRDFTPPRNGRPGVPFDNVFADSKELFVELPFTDMRCTVLAWDDSDLAETGASSVRDVTEDIAHAYWNGPGREDCCAAIADGKDVPGILETHMKGFVDAERARITGKAAV